MLKVAILIPAYNEEATIERLIKELILIKQDSLVIYVIDDGSKDNTVSIARKYNDIIILEGTHQGKGKALKKGINHIIDKEYNIIIFIDADLQHDPKDIPKFIKYINYKNLDMAIGTRLVQRKKMIWQIDIVNFLHTILLNKYLNLELSDYTCGFRAINKSSITNIDWKSNGYSVEIEQIFLARRNNLKIAEVPISAYYHSKKKITIKKIVCMTGGIHKYLYSEFLKEIRGFGYTILGFFVLFFSIIILLSLKVKIDIFNLLNIRD